ncbi:MFS transporter [Maritalea sp.]|uniref:MFS transporter n=1 Tax=Maritalea sp. TaxID=2003361 RepID=UPI003EF83026
MQTTATNSEQNLGIFSKQFLPLTLMNILVVTSHAVNGYVTAVIAPSIVLDLGGREYMFWLFALFQIGSICAGVVAGNFKLRFGARPIFITASILLASGSLLGGVADSLAMVILARGIQGLAEGMLISLVYVVLADHLPAKLLPRMLALSSTLWSVAAAATPALAGTLTQFVSWRAAFLFNLPLVAVLILLAVFYLPKSAIVAQSKSFPIRRLLLLMSALLIAGFAGQIQNTVWLIVIISTSATLLVAFAAFDQKAEDRFMPPNLFSAKTNMGRAFTGLGLFAVGASATNIYMVALLQSIWSLSPLAAGYTVALIAFAWTAFAWMANKIEDHQRQLVSIRLGGTSILAGYLISAAGIYFGQYALVAIGMIFIGAGFGSSSPLIRQIIITQAPKEHKSIASGAIAPVQFTGAVVGATLAGFCALTFGLFEGATNDSVFAVEAATRSGGLMLLAFAVFPIGALFAIFGLQLPTGQPQEEVSQAAN